MADGGTERAAHGRLAACASWCALALLGQAAQLCLTRAGPRIGYQHLRIPEEPGPTWWACVVLLALQSGLVLSALFLGPERRAPRWGAWIARNLEPWQVAALVCALAFSRAKIARPPDAYVLELLVSSWIALASLATWTLAAEAVPARALARFDAAFERLFGRAGDGPEPGGPDRFAWTAALAATLSAALLACFAYERHPHVPDEVPYLIHARTFAEGRLSLAPPPVPAAFDVDLMFLSGERWFSPVPPGWPAALAVGALLGAPWLVNPVLTGLSLLVAYALVRELASRRTARLAVLLLAVSPWCLFLGMSFMTHTWTNLCAFVAALGVARARRTRPFAWTALSGAAIGMVSLVRPLEGLVLALLCGLWAIGLGGARLRAGAVATLVLGAAAVGALVLPYNRALTGDPLRHPIMAYVDQVYGPGKNDLGFGPDKGLDWGGLDPWPGHSPFQALVNAQFNAFALDVELFGWSAGAVLFLALAAFWAPRRGIVRLSLAVVFAVVLANGFYWFSGGPDFGARYWGLAMLPCALLGAAVFEAWRERAGDAAPRAGFGLALATLGALATFVPWRAVDKYHHFRGMRPDVRELAAERGFGRSLVLVRGERHPDYASAAVYNPLDWEAAAPIYAWDRDAEVRAALLAHYGDRPVWILDGPSRTGGGFEVFAGPVRADEVEALEGR